MMHRDITIQELYTLQETIAKPLMNSAVYPWELLKKIGSYIETLGPTLDPERYEKKADNIWIARSAKVAASASVNGPCIIDENAEIRHCAFIRGNVIVGREAVVGNSTELKNVILFNKVQVPHYNYVGDSILGYGSHMGAGAITSNVKSDKSLVQVVLGGERIETGLKKFGAMLGDGVEVGCNTVLNPGTVIGRGSNVYPTSMVRGVLPACCIHKQDGTVVQKRSDSVDAQEGLDARQIVRHVDHTQLKACCTWPDIESLCREAQQYHTASVCIPPCFVRQTRERFGEQLTIGTVVGFPLGYQTPEVKAFEAKQALMDGADEIDMVVNLTQVKAGLFDGVRDELKLLRQVTDGHILKVIVETCYLTEEEKVALCHLVEESGADFIKTSTGFGTAGAELSDIKLFREQLGERVRIKASGGIRTLPQAQEFLEAGCDRLGTSAVVAEINKSPVKGESL